MISTFRFSLVAGVVATCLFVAAPAMAEFSVAPYSLPPTPGTSGGPDALVSLTHSVSNVVVAGSVSCNAAGVHTDNSYWRTFNLPSFGIAQPLDVLSLDLGIELAAAGGGGGSQPATIRYYTDTDTNPGNGGLTLLSTVAIAVPNASLTVLNFPGGPSGVPVGSNLVVEVFTPNGNPALNQFFIGSNAAGQTGPSYLSAADCGVVAPTTTAAIGFPNMHIVMTVNANTVPEPAGLGLTAIGLFGMSILRRRRAVA